MKKTTLITATALLFFFASCGSKSNGSEHDHAAHEGTEHAHVYTCPMHPEVTADKPGQCPKCNMDLVIKESK